LALVSDNDTVRVWDAATGEQRQKLKGDDNIVTAVIFSHDSKLLALVSYNGTVRVWDAAMGEQRQKLKGHDWEVTALTFSYDSKLLASASYNKTVRLWDAATGEQRQKLETASTLSLMNFLSNGAYLHTNVGDLQLDIDSASQDGTSTPVVTLQLAREWVTCQGQDVLWLPHEYRGVCSAAHGNTLVVGQRSGAVSLFRTVDTTNRTATLSAPQKPSNDQY